MNKAYIVVDLGYGDQGKGTTVDWLVRHTGAGTVVRFNGGAQAAHHVVLPDGRWHKFSQFGAGMFVDDVSTYLSKHVMVAPKAMMKEGRYMEKELGIKSPMARTFIDFDAPIISPYHQAANRIIELHREDGAHGSCGIGIGELMEDVVNFPQLVIRAGELFYPDLVRQKLLLIRDHKKEKLRKIVGNDPINPQAAEEFKNCFGYEETIPYFLDIYRDFVQNVHIVKRDMWTAIANQARPIVFEGAQGVLLDEWHGFHPHTTWSTTTFENAYELLDDAGFRGDVERIGVTRAYSTRHGAGPFVTEDSDMTRRLPESHNARNQWQGGMRAGWLDLVALKYACDVAGPMDSLAVTCLDRVKNLGELKVCTEYRKTDGTIMQLERSDSKDLFAREKITEALGTVLPRYEDVGTVDGLLTKIHQATGIQPRILSYGPTHADKEFVSTTATSTP